MQPDEIKIEKEIFDNVIGFIGLTELELEIIGTPIFQRLRHIKQLGLANYVFPGALQNRFNHSIGVLHYADKMICSLQKNETEKSEKKKFLKGTREIIRMAALLHDVGHYPLSHITERVVIKDAELISPPSENSILSEKLLPNENKSEKKFHHPIHELNLRLHKPLGNNFAHHERMSNLVIQETEIYSILRKRFKKDDILKIQEIIAGIHPSFEKYIIHSELDADKFDYLIRDSHQTGVTYGVFDVDQIIRNLKLSDEGELVVGEKGKRAAEHYLMSKYFLYSQVIHHKTVTSFNLMAGIVYKGLLERRIAWSYKDLLDTLDNVEKLSYLMFNDEYFFNLMRGVSNGKTKLPKGKFSVNDDKLRAFIEMLLNRQRLKLVDEQQQLSSQKKYLFSWDEIPGNDSLELMEFIKDKFEIKWIKTANIDKYESDNIIKISNDENFISLKFDDNKTKVRIEIDDGRINNYLVKKENNKLNIFQKINEFTETVINDVCKEAGIEPWWFIEHKISVEPTKMNPHKESHSDSGEDSGIKVLISENDNENSEAINLIDDKSSIIKPLSFYQLDIRRVYTHEKYEQELKKAIRNHRENNKT